jgi:hypothetical protein
MSSVEREGWTDELLEAWLASLKKRVDSLGK